MNTNDAIFQIILSEGGVITTADLERLFALRLGPFSNVSLVAPSHGGNVVHWTADLEGGETAMGRLVVHASAGNGRIVVWAEVFVDDPESIVPSGPSPELLFAEIGNRARRLVHRVREHDVGLPELVAELVGIVDVAEGALDRETARRVAARYLSAS